MVVFCFSASVTLPKLLQVISEAPERAESVVADLCDGFFLKWFLTHFYLQLY